MGNLLLLNQNRTLCPIDYPTARQIMYKNGGADDYNKVAQN